MPARRPRRLRRPGPGNDVSWPQCGKALPKGQTFGIVGVNNGLANNTNPCLKTQLTWAGTSRGGTGQPLVALYVNTGNPGKAGSWWPKSNTYGGTLVANPYGECTDGSYDEACSYMYGYAKAYDDATIRGIKQPGSVPVVAGRGAGNSWSTDPGANRADLEGMAAYFASIGAKTGLYSTRRSGPRFGNCSFFEQPVQAAQLAGRGEHSCIGETQMFGRPADRRRQSHPHPVRFGRIRLQPFLHLSGFLPKPRV